MDNNQKHGKIPEMTLLMSSIRWSLYFYRLFRKQPIGQNSKIQLYSTLFSQNTSIT